MARKKRPTWPTVALTAKVDHHYEPRVCDQDEAIELVDVSDRTLRTWVKKGLPVQHDARGRARYVVPNLIVWARCYHQQLRRGKHVRYLTMEEADRWNLQGQAEEWPDTFVLVPLDWNHPCRERQLRLAAAGMEPPAEED